ncbi:MAG: glycerol-3-phosphate 1-O-acyltransferase PlsY [Candidatus Omnitrophica bacterium]|nr:glycerol-3-phosphate 1-O-acyltransferase PlsY [Candidatus Omnitrophota bacterium]MDD5236710.1 glycerol-3-phosphate 1-O-acyltransferase PlsY [Candidatus Omnitrophota bacterium]MDD5610977.1 glycerol-3-phosphate 1-O-acyltransferase PlsY [Candidatus Omnitrophota bacterium]
MLLISLAIVLSYFIGSIPTAYLFGRAVKGIDIRQAGSGNVGATNAFRVLGKGWGITVFIIDCLKGLLPVFFFGNFIAQQNIALSATLARILIGMACIYGHNWTVFLNFKGGKGVATSLGFLLGLAFSVQGFIYVIISSVLAWIIVFVFSRIVSLASIIASIFLPISVVIFRQKPEIIILALILCIVSLIRHKSNISRLIKGQEHSFKKSQ